MANITYYCPVCKAEIGWNSQLNCFKCEYCDGEFTKEQLGVQHIEDIDKEESTISELEEWEQDAGMKSDDGTEGTDLVKFRCSSCQAEMITDRATAASICVYCGKPMILTSQIAGEFSPKYVIPFEKSKEEAMRTFSEFMNKPLTPKDFKDMVTVEKVQGIYIPFWLFTGACKAKANYEGRKYIKTTSHTVTSGDSKRTEYKHIYEIFNCTRHGVLSFKNIPADGSSKTDDEAMQSIEPYDMSKMIDFNPAYLSGYLAERYDEDASKQEDKIKGRIANSTHDELINTVDLDWVVTQDFDYRLKIDKAEYALFPTWLLYCEYKAKRYLFAMNGQTGKFIGNLPIDKGKLFAIFGAIVGVALVLGILLGLT